MLWNGIMTCMFQMRKLGQQREAKWHVRPYSEWETVNSGNKTLFSLTEREKWTPRWYRISVTWISLLFPPYFSPRKFLPIRCWYFKRLLLNLVIFPLKLSSFIPWGPCLSLSWGVLSGWRWGVWQHAWSLSIRWEKHRPPGCEPVVSTPKLWQRKCLWTLPMSLGENSPYWESMLEERKQRS